MTNYHRQAIDWVTRELDWKAVALEMAKVQPKLFVACAKRVSPSLALDDRVANLAISELEKQVVHHVLQNGGYPMAKITALKFHRELTGVGLGESKQFIEELFSRPNVFTIVNQ
jgi:ribosomal protein L7/L12